MSAGRGVSWRQAVPRHLAVTALIAVVAAAGAGPGMVGTARAASAQGAIGTVSAVSATVIDTLSTADYSTSDGYHRDRLLNTLDPFLRSGVLFRVKLWIISGDTARIVISDRPQLEGFTRAAEGPLASSAPAGRVGAVEALAVPDDGEHRLEADDRTRLLEVFTNFRDAGNNLLSLEAYVPTSVRATAWQVSRMRLPLLLCIVLGASAAALPLTANAVRRSRRLADQRTDLAAIAAAMRDRHRRELAQALHDGPIQNLAAAGIVLSDATAGRSDAGGHRMAAAREIVQTSIAQLRALTAGLLPAVPTPGDLAGNLPGLLRKEVGESVTLDVSVTAAASRLITGPHQVLFSQAALELVRNAVRHGRPSRITVTVTAVAGRREVMLLVRDDGAGFAPGRTPPDGHIGLALLAQATATAGGTLTITSSRAPAAPPPSRSGCREQRGRRRQLQGRRALVLRPVLPGPARPVGLAWSATRRATCRPLEPRSTR
ncbi:ATP-binding protein [Dactylosporangium sp. NPDC049525]|uniref:sensor histidine kinase n=1 Tax=Dactylosporangium sp. NPDC049525 TaxID=3154730 RepID=UPI0034120191